MPPLPIPAPEVVIPQGEVTIVAGVAAVTITTGQVVAREITEADPNRGLFLPADANSVNIDQRRALGIALNDASPKQPVNVLHAGDVGYAALTPGRAFFLSGNAGNICLAEDLVAGSNVCLIGMAKSATVLDVQIVWPDVVL